MVPVKVFERKFDLCVAAVRDGFLSPVGEPMYALEPVRSTELPACQCGRKMRIASIEPQLERSDTHVRIYDCRACHREMWLTVWGTDVLS
jgi:hypothetical protein